MHRLPMAAVILAFKGFGYFALAVIDWLTAKTCVSERHYLLPFRVASEFYDAIVATRHGQTRAPSLTACTRWNRRACGPKPPR